MALEEDRQSMANVGFIGLGAMGSRMANRLLDKGHAVVDSTERAPRHSG